MSMCISMIYQRLIQKIYIDNSTVFNSCILHSTKYNPICAFNTFMYVTVVAPLGIVAD